MNMKNSSIESENKQSDKLSCIDIEEGIDTVEEEIQEDPNQNNEDSISKPFDPTKIDVNIETVNLGSLIEMLENGEIDLNPKFQRASDLWTPIQKSRLIESILLGLPLPSFYFSEDPATQKYAIIDGLQRLCAIRDFVLEKKKPLKLEGLQFLSETMGGKTFDELERPEKRRISSLKITMNTLRKGTPVDVKYIIFQRVNTAGITLTPQEMRHALNQGKPADFIMKLAELEAFKLATNYSVKTKRMQDRDFANRFVAFYLMGYESYNGELDVYLNDAMESLSSKSDTELAAIESVFDKTMHTCRSIFDNDAFRKRNNTNDPRKPISKSVFDTISVNIAWLTDEERALLEKRRRGFRSKLKFLFNDLKFNFSISTGTAQKSNVEKRFTDVKQLIKEVLND